MDTACKSGDLSNPTAIETNKRQSIPQCQFCGKPYTANNDLLKYVGITTDERLGCCEPCIKNIVKNSFLDPTVCLSKYQRTDNGLLKAFINNHFIEQMHLQKTLEPSAYNKNIPDKDIPQPDLSSFVCKIISPFTIQKSNIHEYQIAQNEKIFSNFQKSKTFSNDSHQQARSIAHNSDTHTSSLSLCKVKIKEQSREVVCLICGKCFTHDGNFRVHMRMHTKEHPYSCDICGKAFADNGNLRVHVRTHTGEKPYECEICQKTFAHKSNLQAHYRIHTGEKPYACDICGKLFAGNVNRRVHMRVHSGEKPFSCDTCGKSFAHRGNLRVHTRVHTGEKPFVCGECGKTFAYNGSLRVHLRAHRTH